MSLFKVGIEMWALKILKIYMFKLIRFLFSYSREKEIISVLHPTYILYLTRLGTLNPNKNDIADKLMSKLLQCMETESEVELKRVYGAQLRPLLLVQVCIKIGTLILKHILIFIFIFSGRARAS